MTNLLDYNDSKAIINSNNGANRSFGNIEKLIDVSKVKKCYVKNIFNKVSPKEMYMLTEDKIIISSFNPLNLTVYRLQEIQNVKVNFQGQYELSLNIVLKDGIVIEFNNVKDSNEDWQSDYFNYIIDIANFLMN
ncbi:hypothetical protein [Clostridium sp. YIM B02506]|uniref:hypothetical protein n=1 Tax=Clostridium sp. YIM B02506 TaxID=2910680 RepID=UPI001EEE219D|nr:hypothetical protein [Clostridium sp. YIM B02506]